MSSLFESKEKYLEFKTNWKKVTNDAEGPKLTLEHFILYQMIRGKNWKTCLAPTSKESTIDSATYTAEKCNPKYLSLWPFGDTISESMIIEARNRMENI